MMKKLLIFILLLFISGCEKVKEKPREPIEENYKVSLIAVGDNLIHQTIYQAAATDGGYDFKPIFEEIKPYIKTFDLAFINQETILGGSEIGLSSYPRFNSPHELGDAVIDSGFNLISIANNHTLDRGEIAIGNSINYWQNKDIIYSGSEAEDVSNIKYFEKKNISFAFVAYTYGTNGITIPNGKEYLANLYDNEKAFNDLKEARQKAEIVIVSMHWGNEYESLPSSIQKEQANYLSSLGVDIIIGHHPHVIQPVDLIKNDSQQTFVIYSLGNFLSDQVGIDRLIGMAVSLDINKNIKNNEIKINISNYKSRLLYRYKNNNLFKIKQFIDIDEIILSDNDQYFNDKQELIKTYFKDIKVE